MASSLPKVGETFSLPLSKVQVPVTHPDNPLRNYRSGLKEDLDLDALAESIKAEGLLQPVLVAYIDGAWVLVAGFRRVWAMRAHPEMGFRTVRVHRVDADRADVVRLVENFNRENPTTADTCRYLYELSTGKRGPKRSLAELSDATGLSTSHLKNLIRFWRVLPEVARDAWAADRDGRFTFRVLHRLAAKAQSEGSSDAEINAAIDIILGRAEPETTGPAGPKTANTDDAEGGGSGGSGGSGSGLKKLSARMASKLRQKLDAAGPLVGTDDRAHVAGVFLDVLCGAADASVISKLIDELLTDLGVRAEAPKVRKPRAPRAAPKAAA